QNHPQCPMQKFIYKFFNITDEQQAALEKVRQDSHAAIEPYFEQIKPLGEQLQATLLAETIDTAKAAELFKGINDIEALIIPIEANSIVQGAQILTTEQRADIQGVLTDVTSYLKYIMAYPGLDDLRNKYGKRMQKAMIDTKLAFLNLTEEQKTALIALQDKTADAIKLIAEQMGTLHQDFTAALLSATVDTEAAASLISQMAEPAAQMADIQFNAVLEAAQILTPEQRQIILDKINKHKKFHHPMGK
ncbi:MAG: Spy/CpxP family protein refolding chaperone, partial [Proteobacteria bacterium]|nr:Spy/CpxP family protein refolding chaperone [Pseudomonadota bacterium]